jgi:predicted RNA-binding protein with PIN domain
LEQRPDRFILDGYNIAGEIHNAEFSTRSARDDVVHRAGRLARCTEAEVLVVFDGQDDQASSGFRTSEGVIVRFSRGEKADDVIVALVAGDAMRTVVVTNDRELRDRCTATDCVPIWSTAFVEWLS